MVDSIAVVQPESILNAELISSSLSVYTPASSLKALLGSSTIAIIQNQNQEAILESIIGGGAVSTLTTDDNDWHTIQTIAITASHVFNIDVTILAKQTDLSIDAFFHLDGFFRNNGGTVTRKHSKDITPNTLDEDVNWGARFLINGTDVEVQVNSATDEVNWKAEREVLSV